jgi:hypothetical protein
MALLLALPSGAFNTKSSIMQQRQEGFMRVLNQAAPLVGTGPCFRCVCNQAPLPKACMPRSVALLGAAGHCCVQRPATSRTAVKLHR